MDVILNDYSLDNQFSDIDDFTKSLKENTIPIIIFSENLSKEQNCNNIVYKSQNSFNRKVFKDKTLYDLFRLNGNKSSIQKLLSFLSICKKPFWDQESMINENDVIQIEKIGDKHNCIVEAHYRNICLLSFKNDLYKNTSIQFFKNEKSVNSQNAITKNQFIESLPICYGIEIKEGHDIEYNNKKVFFEVRDDENGKHKSPHFHLTEKEGKNRSVSIQIDSSFTYLAGKKDLRLEWLEWCKNNYFYIKEMWNYRHPERLIEDRT